MNENALTEQVITFWRFYDYPLEGISYHNGSYKLFSLEKIVLAQEKILQKIYKKVLFNKHKELIPIFKIYDVKYDELKNIFAKKDFLDSFYESYNSQGLPVDLDRFSSLLSGDDDEFNVLNENAISEIQKIISSKGCISKSAVFTESKYSNILKNDSFNQTLTQFKKFDVQWKTLE